MAKYEGPSYFNGEDSISFDPAKKQNKPKSRQYYSTKKEKTWRNESATFENTHAKTLPNQVKRREEIEKGFREYLREKKTFNQKNRSNYYVSPPFEASKVPSPIFGYKEPPVKKKLEEWDYGVLKEELQKENYEFMLFEEYETPELKDLWEMLLEDEPPLDITEEQTSLFLKTPKEPKKNVRLYRSLSGIIEEDKSGANYYKRNVPGFFSDNKD